MHPIEKYCLENHIKKRELAKKLHISGMWLKFITDYKTRPSRAFAREISALTGIKVSDLLFFKWNSRGGKCIKYGIERRR